MNKILILLSALLLSSNVNAALVDLNSGSFYSTIGGVGTGRGVSFKADSNFSISSLGLRGDLVAQSFDVLIYSSTDGNQVNSVLASASSVVGGTGLGWNDININYSFNAGSYYAFNWRPTNGNSSWGTIDYYRDNALPTSIGSLLTLINGFEGFNATNFSNSLHPNLRINTSVNAVPIPAAAFMFVPALLGFMGLRRKAKNSVA